MTTDEPAQWLILGRYRVLGELGRGAMGIVYKVHDERLDRVIALKTIRKDVYAVAAELEQNMLDRFRREARAAGKLSHPGIVTIYDISEEGDDLYIAMEFVDGERLGDRMRAMRRTPVAEAARIVRNVSEALAYAHAHGVVHRDVKPDNIMCCPNGDVKLTDFGIARIVSAEAATRTGRLMGTPRYMAPEQWRGDPVDGRTDVFAVGVILYEMLTGRPTFRTQSPTELQERVLHEDPVPPSRVHPPLPAAIDPIVRRAIAREPSDRYATAGELARALAPFVSEAFATLQYRPEKAIAALRAQAKEATAFGATLPSVEPGFVTGRMTLVATVIAVIALSIAGAWWARPAQRSLPMPPTSGVATAAAPAIAARIEETSRAVEATPTGAASTASAAEPTPEIAPAHRDAGATLADPEQTDATKLAVIDTLANDSSEAATDVLLESTRNASILVSMAAVKALAGRPCARTVGPLTALLVDKEWQRRAWAAKILGVDGCDGARDALVARRGNETDARVTKLVDDAIKKLDDGEGDR